MPTTGPRQRDATLNYSMRLIEGLSNNELLRLVCAWITWGYSPGKIYRLLSEVAGQLVATKDLTMYLNLLETDKMVQRHASSFGYPLSVPQHVFHAVFGRAIARLNEMGFVGFDRTTFILNRSE